MVWVLGGHVDLSFLALAVSPPAHLDFVRGSRRARWQLVVFLGQERQKMLLENGRPRPVSVCILIGAWGSVYVYLEVLAVLYMIL